jgi:hypothetical protein
VLATEFGPAEEGGMHALALTLRTPEEHAALAGRTCLNGCGQGS